MDNSLEHSKLGCAEPDPHDDGATTKIECLHNGQSADTAISPMVSGVQLSVKVAVNDLPAAARLPQFWPARKKRAITALVCMNYFMFTWITTAVVSNTVTAALQDKFHATYVQIAQYSVAIPALALAVSPLFWTPLAKTYGRRPIMILGVLIAFISCIGAAVTKTYGGYMAARFFQGWGVGPASTVGLQVSCVAPS